MIRFAVVGTNWITERFIDAAHESGKLKLSAVYSRSLEQAQALNGPVNQAIVDTARFLKEQGKVPAAGTDYRQYVTDRFVK